MKKTDTPGVQRQMIRTVTFVKEKILDPAYNRTCHWCGRSEACRTSQYMDALEYINGRMDCWRPDGVLMVWEEVPYG